MAISTAFNDMADAVQDRLERERRFSANVSHELRSPLTGIMGTADLLESRLDRLPPREATLVEALNRQVRRFSATVLDLLEISRIGGDQLVQTEQIDICLLIDELLAGRGLDRELRQGDDDLRLLTDPRRCERVVGNLIDNAQRHGEGLTSLLVERTEEGVRLTADDAGPGIPEDLAGQIFEPFARRFDLAGRGRSGTGHRARTGAAPGGNVAVGTSAAGGARFVVDLPDRGRT